MRVYDVQVSIGGQPVGVMFLRLKDERVFKIEDGKLRLAEGVELALSSTFDVSEIEPSSSPLRA